ncbi:T6SS effector BTH_I2691 family protein [Acinetobacter sp. BWR-L5]|uniref:T6SS effector BTH_I2691 family protein n=1 Tax=Acinetobacter sp. BWR-L5 TaxID=2815725 RepID=UPI0031FE8453
MTDNSVAEKYRYDRCETCERLGSFYPVRIAVALETGNSDNFKVNDNFAKKLPALPKGLKYVYRRLNEGYLYAYAKEWRVGQYNDENVHAYNVNANGFISAMDKDSMGVQPKAKDYACFINPVTSKQKSSSNAMLLDLFPNKDVSPVVDLFYSRHQLSIESCNQFETDENLRKKICSQINVSKPTDYQLPYIDYMSCIENSTQDQIEVVKKLVPWEADLIKDMAKYPFHETDEFSDETGESTFNFQAIKTDKNNKPVLDPKTKEPLFDESAPAVPYVTSKERVIVFNDPVGILEDTLSIINYLAEKIRTPEEERLYQSALQIIKLKGLIKAKIHSEKYSELWNLYGFRYGAEHMLEGIPEQDKANIHVPMFPTQDQAEKAQKSIEKIHDNMMLKRQHYMENFFDFEEKDIIKLTKDVNEEFDTQWNKKSFWGMVDSFSDKLKQKAMDDWLEQQAQKILDYGKTEIEPIIKFYIEWLKSDTLLNYMENAFDHKSPFSASNFITINSRIVGNADTLELCSKYFEELLQEANYSNRKNYLLRTFIFDSKSLQDTVNSVNDFLGRNQITTLAFAGTQFFDESSITQHDNYKEQVKTIKESIKVKIDIFSEQIGGTVARVFHGRANQTPDAAKTVAMKSFEVFSGKTLTTKAYAGKLTDIIQQIMRDSPINFDEAESRQAKKNAKNAFKVNLKKALLENFNTDIDFHRLGKVRTKVHMVLHLDTQQLAKINPNMTQAQISEAMHGAVRGSGQVVADSKVAGALEQSRQLNQLEGQSQKVFARQGTGFGFGVFAFSLQSLALISATQGAAKGINLQTGTNFVGVIAATLGNIADVMDRQLQMRILQLGEIKSLVKLQGRYAVGAKIGLYGGALLLAVVEWMKAYDAWQKDKYIITGLYIANGFIVILTAHAFLRSSVLLLGLRGGYWGLILIGVSVVISYGIDLLEEREIRNFLEASAWGTNSENWTQAIEDTKFKKLYE